MNDVIVFDTETTGIPLPGVADLDQQPRIIELGAVRVRAGQRIAELSQLLQPHVTLTAEQTKHAGGITNEMLANKPDFKSFLPQLKEFFLDARYLVAHNASFDRSMLLFELLRCGGGTGFKFPEETICSIDGVFRKMFGPKQSMKLTAVYERVIGKPLIQTHRALDDVNALVEVLDKVAFWSMLDG